MGHREKLKGCDEWSLMFWRKVERLETHKIKKQMARRNRRKAKQELREMISQEIYGNYDKETGILSIQNDKYHDDGWHIIVIGKEFKVYEDVLDSEPELVGTFDNIKEAYAFALECPYLT